MCQFVWHVVCYCVITDRLFYDDEDEDTGDNSIFKELDNVEEPGT